MTIEEVHQLSEVRIVAIGGQAEVAHNSVAVCPALLTLQATEGQAVTMCTVDPRRLRTMAGDDDLSFTAAQGIEEVTQLLPVGLWQERVHLSTRNAADRFEI